MTGQALGPPFEADLEYYLTLRSVERQHHGLAALTPDERREESAKTCESLGKFRALNVAWFQTEERGVWRPSLRVLRVLR